MARLLHHAKDMAKPLPELEIGVVASDFHFPFHSPKGWSIFLQTLDRLQPMYVVINGDFVDFYAISDHAKHPARLARFEEELQASRAGLREIERLLPNAKLIYIDGNHEDRLRRYLWSKAPELHRTITISNLLDLSRWTHIDYKKHWKLGKMHFTHDVGVAGRTAVTRALDTYQHCVITGHSHRFQLVVEGNALGESKLSASFGWLGDVDQIDYMHEARANKDWALGFGVFRHDPTTGVVYVQPVPIVNSRAMVDGLLVVA